MHTSGRTSLDDLDWTTRRWDGTQAYCDSKLLVTTLAAAVARHWPDVRSNAVDPGWVPTRMGGPHATDDLALGHDTQVWLATSDEPGAPRDRSVLVPPPGPNTRSSRERHRLPGPPPRHPRTNHRRAPVTRSIGQRTTERTSNMKFTRAADAPPPAPKPGSPAPSSSTRSATLTSNHASGARTSDSHPAPAPHGTPTPEARRCTSPTASATSVGEVRDVQEIRPGDVVYIEPDEEHWHGATPERFMAHVAIQEADDNGQVVTWGEHVTDDEYGCTTMTNTDQESSPGRSPSSPAPEARIGRSTAIAFADRRVRTVDTEQSPHHLRRQLRQTRGQLGLRQPHSFVARPGCAPSGRSHRSAAGLVGSIEYPASEVPPSEVGSCTGTCRRGHEDADTRVTPRP